MRHLQQDCALVLWKWDTMESPCLLHFGQNTGTSGPSALKVKKNGLYCLPEEAA